MSAATAAELRRHRLLSWMAYTGTPGDTIGAVGVCLLLLVAGRPCWRR